MANRHRVHRAKGGRTVYAGAGSHVAREAGNTADHFAHGGHKKHHVGHVHGEHSKPRLDKRARGGRTGSNHSPFSSAAIPQDVARTERTKDHAQPRKEGGRTAFAHGGGVRPHAHNKHHMNFGHHGGAGHEEPLETHHPLHHKHGGAEGEHLARGGGMHYRGGKGRKAGKHAAGGRIARAEGGRTEHEHKKHEEDDEDKDEDEDEDGKARHIDIYKTRGGVHHWADAEKDAEARTKGGRSGR